MKASCKFLDSSSSDLVMAAESSSDSKGLGLGHHCPSFDRCCLLTCCLETASPTSIDSGLVAPVERQD